jgi:phosphoglycerol transferase MdoB-like AlkP superfamily enzyme
MSVLGATFMIGVPAIILIAISFFLSKNENPQIRPKILHFITSLIIFIFVLTIVPVDLLGTSSPLTEVFYPIYKEKWYLEYTNLTNKNQQKECNPILNISIYQKRPNVIVLMLESVPAEHISYYGYERNVSPNIDSLASQSIVFKNAYSSASSSEYSQTSFLSSRYPLATETKSKLYSGYKADFIWDAFRKNNYSTAYITSQDDRWMNMINYYNISNLNFYSSSMTDGISDHIGSTEEKDYDETTAGKAIDWINKSKNNSFFIYVGFQANHYPYDYPENNSIFTPDEVISFFTNYAMLPKSDFNSTINRYDNALRYADKNFGKIIDFLKEQGIFNNSIVILTADHGEDFTGNHGYLRHGLGIYETEVHIPLAISIPGQNHSIITDRVKQLDLLPTILNILNFSIPEKFQGTEMCKDKPIFLMSQNNIERIGLIKDDIKYIINLRTYNVEAFNLSEDNQEKNNLLLLNNSEFFKKEYNPLLLNWYNCQLNYYKKGNWSEKINCG